MNTMIGSVVVDKIQSVQTSFGRAIGCEVDEISQYILVLRREDKLANIWNKWVNKEQICKSNELLKIMYGLTILTLKHKQNVNGLLKKNSICIQPPPTQAMKRLTAKIYKRLPVHTTEGKKLRLLTRQNFIQNLHTYLHDIHEEIVDKEKKQKRSF